MESTKANPFNQNIFLKLLRGFRDGNKEIHIFSQTLLKASTFYYFSKPNVSIQGKQIELL